MGDQLLADTTVVAVEEQLSTSVDGEEVILHTESSTYFGLNAVGKFIWDELAEPHTVEELQEAIIAEFDVSPEQGRRDVDEFLGSLLEAELIKRVDEQPQSQ